MLANIAISGDTCSYLGLHRHFWRYEQMEPLLQHRQIERWRPWPASSFSAMDRGMTYDGGKGGAGVCQQIINQIPPHRVYIEAFLGAGRVLRTKRPAEHSIGVEVDDLVLNERWQGDEVPGLQLVCGDAVAFLRDYPWTGDEFVYLDPPYPMPARSTQRAIYRHEFATIEEHRALLTLLRTLPCPVAISGYHSWLYELELAGWRSISYQTVKRSGALGVEHLWMNYGPPQELHDYSFLGGDFREREQIGRLCERWKARLRQTLNPERQALLAAIEEVRSEFAGQPRAIQDYHSLGSTFRERDRVARKCKRWQEWLRRIPELVRQALFVAIDEVRREFAEEPHTIIRAARAMCRRPACSRKWRGPVGALVPASPLDALTEREQQILEQVAAGFSNNEIAQRLSLSEKTVKYYMTNILQKLQVRNRVEAALLAQQGGLMGYKPA